MGASERKYGQQAQMEHASMVETLRAQAEMIWPLERPLLLSWGFDQLRRVADLGCGTGEFAGRVARAWPLVTVTGLDLFEGHLALARGEDPAGSLGRASALADGIAAARAEIEAIDADMARKALLRARFYRRSGKPAAAVAVLHEAGRTWGSTEPGKECAEEARRIAAEYGVPEPEEAPAPPAPGEKGP